MIPSQLTIYKGAYSTFQSCNYRKMLSRKCYVCLINKCVWEWWGFDYGVGFISIKSINAVANRLKWSSSNYLNLIKRCLCPLLELASFFFAEKHYLGRLSFVNQTTVFLLCLSKKLAQSSTNYLFRSLHGISWQVHLGGLNYFWNISVWSPFR